MTKPQHKGSFKAVKRNANLMATAWGGTCSCGEIWFGRSYEAVEDKWRKHRWEVTGMVPEPSGRKTRRWKPPEKKEEVSAGQA